MAKEEFEDTKGVIRIRKSKEIGQHTMTKRKRTNNDLQNITHKTKDRVIQTSLKPGGEVRCSRRISSSILMTFYQNACMLSPATGKWFEIMILNFVVKGNINCTNTRGKQYTKEQKIKQNYTYLKRANVTHFSFSKLTTSPSIMFK